MLTGGLTASRTHASQDAIALLDKAQAAMIWYYSIGNEHAQERTPAERYREQISAVELLQAAALLHSFEEDNQTELAARLLPMLPRFRLAPEELFELNELLGNTVLRELVEIETPYIAHIPVEAARFRAQGLNNAERVVLAQEPTTALEVMRAIDVLSVLGRPQLVRHYLRRFLAGEYEFTPEEAANIVEAIGVRRLMQLAFHPEFATLGQEVVMKLTGGEQNEILVDTFVHSAERRLNAMQGVRVPANTAPFAGSSIISETLIWQSKSDGRRVILSGHPQMASALQTANLFLSDDYRAEVATTCRELLRLAAELPDVEFVIVDARTASPPVGDFVQMMRQHPRMADIPIAILGETEQHRNTLTQLDWRDFANPFRTSLSITYPRPTDAEAALWIRDDLLERTAAIRQQTHASDRLEMAKQALRYLREIKLAELESGIKIYHFVDFDAVVLNAMQSDVRFREGLELAAVVRSPALQWAIYDMAANAIYPMWVRELAGDAFEEHVQRFGVLLRGPQIQRLYDRYNASEFESVESQELLSRMIDVVVLSYRTARGG